MDANRPTPQERQEQERLIALPFRMIIEDVIRVKGRGVFVGGRIAAGRLREGDAIVITGGEEPLHTHALKFEPYESAKIDYLTAGDNVGILLPKDVSEEQVKLGMICTKAGEE